MEHRRAVIYARISRDRDGLAAGVERQLTDCRTHGYAHGYLIVAELVDNDVSAFSGRPRPAYDQLLSMIAADRVDVVLIWHPDRLTRRPAELETFVELVERHRVQVATVTAGDVDLATPEGRLVARIAGAVARKESEDKSRRLRRKHRELAEEGRVSGGGVRPFGFEHDRITHRPDEAALITEAGRRVLAGESLYRIAQTWDERGIRTVRDVGWSTTALRTVLLAPRIAGLREYEGERFPAVWEPIIPVEEWESIGRVLRARSRARTQPPRRYLLTGGLIRCASCEAAMVAAPRPYGRSYACLAGHGGCNRVTIKSEPVEDLVVEAALAVLDTPALADHLQHTARDSERSGALDELAALERRMDELADMFATGEIDRPRWRRAHAELDERRAVLERVAATTDVDPLADLAPGQLTAAWPGLGLERQRAILSTVIERIEITPAQRRGGRVDLSRVTIRWIA